MKNFPIIRQKIYTRENILPLLAVWRFQDKKVVFTNGCFDILHLGHIHYLSEARDLGDVLIVGVNTDASVKRIKGVDRPITDEISRSTIIAALHFTDAVILFDYDTPYNLIKLIQPDVLVKGNDYKAEDIVGYDIVKAKGGEINTIDFLPEYSTSGIEKRIKKTN